MVDFGWLGRLMMVFVCTVFAKEAAARDLRIDSVEWRRGSKEIRFDVRWADSWRYGKSHAQASDSRDALWIFVKYAVHAESELPKNWRWHHASIDPARTTHGGADLIATPDRKGVFLSRSRPGVDPLGCGPEGQRGDVCLRGIPLKWDPPTPGDGQVLSLWVHGIEMVYVPAGAFFVGDPCDGNCLPGAFYQVRGASSASRRARRIDSEGEIPIGSNEGDLSYDVQGADLDKWGDGVGPLPAQFPKGYAAFYAMKYELTQGQYTDFINSLFGEQRTLRYPYFGEGNSRFEIFMGAAGRRVALRPDRAMNYVGWADAAAYLDWAALRPLTELEYEKLARGPAEPVHREYAWGTPNATVLTTIVGSDSGNFMTDGNLNAGRPMMFRGDESSVGPLTGDAFEVVAGPELDALFPPARSTFGASLRDVWFHHREIEGRSYYGAMQLSGNLWELTVGVGNPAGRRFDGRHGDGCLSLDSDSDLVPGSPSSTESPGPDKSWPQADGWGVAHRGGAWFAPKEKAMVASRSDASHRYRWRSHDVGIRGARSEGFSPANARAGCAP